MKAVLHVSGQPWRPLVPPPHSLIFRLLPCLLPCQVFASVSHEADGTPVAPAVGVPLPIQGLASRRVLVMEYVEGTPLNRLASVM